MQQRGIATNASLTRAINNLGAVSLLRAWRAGRLYYRLKIMTYKRSISLKQQLKHLGSLMALVTAFASTASYGQTPGGLDASFGVGGKVLTNFGGTGDMARSVVVQPDGKLVAAGTTNVNGATDFALVRYYDNGALDPSFGVDGKVVTDFAGSYDSVGSLVLQADGKIIAGGWSVVDSIANFALARYNTDGTLDAGFGAGGKVRTDFGGVSAQVFATALQPDGKIVVAGYVNIDGGAQFALARYSPDGTLDAGFGSEGKVTTAFGADQGFSFAQANSLAIQPDGRILAGGLAFVEGFGFALARYNSDGTLDASFGAGGTVTTPFGSNCRAFSIALQPDGKIVAAGTANSDFALARYNSDGTLDGDFGLGGKVITDIARSSGALAVAIQSDGKIVAVGQSFVNGNYDFAVARYGTNGSLDPDFAIGGKATTNFADLADQAFSVAIQSDGKIVAAGVVNVDGNTKVALARYL